MLISLYYIADPNFTTQPSRPHALRVGDRVRYVGGSPFTTPPLPTLSDRILRCLPDPLSGSQLSRREKSRGPPFGATGRTYQVCCCF